LAKKLGLQHQKKKKKNINKKGGCIRRRGRFSTVFGCSLKEPVSKRSDKTPEKWAGGLSLGRREGILREKEGEKKKTKNCDKKNASSGWARLKRNNSQKCEGKGETGSRTTLGREELGHTDQWSET